MKKRLSSVYSAENSWRKEAGSLGRLYIGPMSKLISPPDYSCFSIADLETTYAQLRDVAHSASNAICCAPQISGVGRSSPTPSFIESRVLNTTLDDLAALADHLRQVKFGSPDHNERALLLLIKYELDFGEATLTSIQALVGCSPAGVQIAA
jgi:hypothetical protein